MPMKSTVRSDIATPEGGRQAAGNCVYPTRSRQPRDDEDRPKAHCVSTQRVLAQDEEDRPQATASIIQARWQPSGVHDTAGTVQARN